jgi:S-adenosyl-L-methionine hydrolase (adenosine-forming)
VYFQTKNLIAKNKQDKWKTNFTAGDAGIILLAMGIITLTTDFGSGSPYVAAMKGVILSINPNATIVDLTHEIPPQDVRQAALALEDASEFFPPDTLHAVVVDPEVGTQRAIVYARIGNQQYIAPDNGVLSRLAVKTTPAKTIRVSESRFWLDNISATFHGRDIIAPVAARLSMGLPPEQLGPLMERIVILDWPSVRISSLRIDGSVLEIDSFGNIITNITTEMLAGRPTDRRACIACNIFETWGIYHTYADQPRGTLCALIGSGGRMELAIVGDNAAARLGIKVGMPVAIAWE